MLLYMERDKYFSSLLYSICEGLNSFFSFETQKKMCLVFRKKPYLSPLLKDAHSRMTLKLKLRIGKFSLLYATLLQSRIQSFLARGKVSKQERSRSCALKSICFFFFFKVLRRFIEVNLSSFRSVIC